MASPLTALLLKFAEQIITCSCQIRPGKGTHQIQRVLVNEPVEPAGVPVCSNFVSRQHFPPDLLAVSGGIPGNLVNNAFSIHNLPLQRFQQLVVTLCRFFRDF
ncbi:hypothetical protein D3C87_1740610 [compost metagenome]